MKPFLHLKSVDEVMAIIYTLKPLSGESVDLAEAGGRYLCGNFHAPADLPGFVRSSMDGYAVATRDVFGASESMPAFLQVAGDCPVGRMPDFRLESGEAATIVTGAPLPPGADAVVMVEDSREAAKDQIEIIRPVAPGANTVDADEDAKQGQILISFGSLLRPQDIGILAAYGIQRVNVYKRPEVAIISTGDEIVSIDTMPGPCKLRDVNSWSLASLCSLHNGLPLRMGIVSDDPGSLQEKLLQCLELADVVLVSGGSSAGMRDHTVDAFLSLPDASLLVHGVAMRPGKPFILAKSGAKLLLGLPGHVTSALICAHVFLIPILGRLQGQTEIAPKPWIDARLSRSVASAQGRRDYIRCHLEQEEGEFVAQPLRSPSAVLGSLLAAEGLVICPENLEGLSKNQQVKFYPFS